jgi:hypothetical protein
MNTFHQINVSEERINELRELREQGEEYEALKVLLNELGFFLHYNKMGIRNKEGWGKQLVIHYVARLWRVVGKENNRNSSFKTRYYAGLAYENEPPSIVDFVSNIISDSITWENHADAEEFASEFVIKLPLAQKYYKIMGENRLNFLEKFGADVYNLLVEFSEGV